MDSASRLPFQLLDGTSDAHFSLADSTRNPTTLPLKLVLQRDILLIPSRWSSQNPIGSYPTSVQASSYQDYQAMVAQLEHQFRLGRLSIQGLWFYCQSLLELALRKTAAAADPCHEKLTCCVERSSLLNRLVTLRDLDCGMKNLVTLSSEIENPYSDSSGQAEPFGITGLETFSLCFKVRWPLSVIISRKALTKHQLSFRFLFHCKHVHCPTLWSMASTSRCRSC